jgi:hypothetical protein
MEQMMARLLAEIKFEIRTNQAKTDANQAEIKANQAKQTAILGK